MWTSRVTRHRKAAMSKLDWDVFSILHDRAYLNSAAHGLVPVATRGAVGQYLAALEAGATEADFRPAVEETRKAVATLLEVDVEHLYFTANTSMGMAIAIRALDWHSGDSVVWSPDYEFPSTTATLEALEGRAVRLVRVPLPKHRDLTADDLLNAADARTRLIVVSAVNFRWGTTLDLAALSVWCSTHDACLLLDAAQAVGVTRLLREAPEAVWAANGHKGLLGVAGTGLLVWPDRWVPVSGPRVHGMIPEWLPGHANSLGLTALGASASWLQQHDLTAAQDRILAVRGNLVQSLERAGYRVWSPLARSAIITLREHFVDPAGLIQTLAGRGIDVAVRDGWLRASIHGYTTPTQTERLVEALLTLQPPVLAGEED